MPEKQDRSIGELFGELASESSQLIRQEIALAKVELTETATSVGKNIGFLVLGGAVAYAALLTLLAAVVLLLADHMPSWAAALLVAVLVGIVAAVLVSKAIASLKKTDVTPRQTVQTFEGGCTMGEATGQVRATDDLNAINVEIKSGTHHPNPSSAPEGEQGASQNPFRH